VQAGGNTTGQVLFTNQTGAARQVRLELDTTGASASISPGGAFPVPAANPPSVPFTVTVSKTSPTGTAWLRVKVVDATTGQVYNEVTQVITVKKPPGFWATWLWRIIGLLILLALIIAGLFALRARRRWKKSVTDLTAYLRRDGTELGAPLKAPQKWSDTFSFIIHDEGGPDPRLDWPQPGMPVYQARRSGNGMVRLLTPNGDGYDIVVGSSGERLEHNGLELAFRDRRRTRARGGHGGHGGPQRARVPASPGTGATAVDPLDPFYQPPAPGPTRLDSVDSFHEQETRDITHPPAQYPPTPPDEDWLH